MSDRHPNVTNVTDGDWVEQAHGARFAFRAKRLGAATGGKRLGCMYYEVPPGKAAFPYHAHFGTEEAVYVLEGEGTLRLGGKEVRVGPGDYAAFGTGEEGAHQLVNTGAAPLRYLCFSAGTDPDVVTYPDSKKIGVLSGAWPTPRLREIVRREPAGYWDGED